MPHGNWPSGWANISLNKGATALPVLIKEKGFWMHNTRNGSMSFRELREF